MDNAKIKTAATSNVSKGVVLLIATMSAFLAPFTGSSVNIALPSISSELSLNAIALSWVPTAYLLAAAMSLVPLGRISDLVGRKRIFLYGTIINAAASIMCAVSNSGPWLVAFRATQGLGSAMTFGTGVAILTSVFPANERGRALGINAAAVYSGLSMGPMIGGFLTASLGWRSIFVLVAFIGLIITVTVLWKLKEEWVGARGEKFDYAGSLIYSLSLVSIMYAFSVLPALWGIWLIIAGVTGLVVFLRWEMRQKYPVLDIGLFRSNTVFAFSNLAAFINYSAVYAVGFLMSIYLQYIKGFAPEYAGLVLLAQPVPQVIFSPIAGTLSDRIEPRVVASIGMALTTTGLVMLSFLNANSGLVFIILSLVILGTGYGLFSSPNTNAVMGSVDKRLYGVAGGMLATMRLTGQAFSLGISLLLFSIYIGRVQITPEYYPLVLTSLKTAFTIASVLCFGGIFASIARGKTRE